MLYQQLTPQNGYVIAETACGHCGDLEKLKQLIDCTADSGAKIIKFQIFKTEERAIKGKPEWDIFSRVELDDEEWEQAINYARRRNLIVFSDIFGKKSFSLAKKLGINCFKIHSEDLLNSYFIAQVAEEAEILLIGVGAAHRIEIYSLLNFLKQKNLLNNIILMTGIQTFPTPIEAHSLGEVSELIRRYSDFGVKIGFSDHINGDLEEAKIVPLMALAKGASIIEKHFTVNRNNKWTDYQSALDKDEFKNFAQLVSNLSPLLKGVGSFSSSENKYWKMFKKSPVLARDAKEGHILTSEDIEFKKDTNNAIPFSSLNLVGRQLKNDMKAGEVCRLANIKNKIGGIIVARCTSNRLPNKALRLIQGRESIALLIDRMKRCKNMDCLILATSTDPSDDVLAEIAKREGIFSFRGSLDNVSSRFYKAASHYKLDHFVRITGDAILCDEIMVDKAIESHLENCCDVTFMRNMPHGTKKEVVSLNAIKTILDTSIIASNTEYLEYYLENDRYFSINYLESDYEFDPNLRITLDYEEDLEFLSRIFEHFNKVNPEFTLKDALGWLREHPEVARINMHKNQKFSSRELNVELKI